eukprot:TRINITY_DN4219_c0_g1_i1.p1 TRINITY_DN4219_c0_g1~~TRINITY_DN4219_c0_g1_i1.p1  ORF type:complete len:181 (+),score=30.86 TRINITY_DN4219_c0_g1_i1:43-585(+)
MHLMRRAASSTCRAGLAEQRRACGSPSLRDVRHRTFPHRLDVPLRWGDMDGYGHVNNCTYTVLVENSRTTLLNQLFVDAGMGNMPEDPTKAAFAPIIAELSIKYVAPMEWPDTMICDSCVTHVSETGAEFWINTRGTSEKTGATAIVAVSKVVFLDYNAKKRPAVPDAMRASLQKWSSAT